MRRFKIISRLNENDFVCEDEHGHTIRLDLRNGWGPKALELDTRDNALLGRTIECIDITPYLYIAMQPRILPKEESE